MPPEENHVLTFQAFTKTAGKTIGDFVKKEFVHFDVCEILLLGNHLIESTSLTNLAGRGH